MTSRRDVDLEKKKNLSRDVSLLFPAMAAGAGPCAAPKRLQRSMRPQPTGWPDVRADYPRIVHASEPATQRPEAAGAPRCAQAQHARLHAQIWASPWPYLGTYVTQESI